jgi:hypothetical protein
VCWKRTGAGVAGQHLVNSIASVLWILTHSFHLVKYRSKTDVAWVSRLTMVSVRQDCVRIAVSSAYSTSCVLGGVWNIRDVKCKEGGQQYRSLW